MVNNPVGGVVGLGDDLLPSQSSYSLSSYRNRGRGGGQERPVSFMEDEEEDWPDSAESQDKGGEIVPELAPTDFADHALTTFSRAIRPPNYSKFQALPMFAKIKEALFTSEEYSRIAQLWWDACMWPEYDCVVYLVDEQPPFDKVLKDYKTILAKAFDLKADEEVRMTRYFLQFIIPELDRDGGRNPGAGMLITLSPATFYDYDDDKQRQEVIKLIEVSKDSQFMYCSSIRGFYIEWMHNQTPLAQDVARLAKFWYNSLFFAGEYVPRINMILELVSVSASEIKNNSIWDAFQMFLHFMSRLSTLKIIFIHKKNGQWKSLSCSGPGPFIHSFRIKFPQYEELGLLKKQRFILDPANMFNDLLDDDIFPASLKGKIQDCAKNILNKFKAPKVILSEGVPYIALSQLFRPLPNRLIAISLNVTNVEFLISGVPIVSLIYPIMKINKAQLSPNTHKSQAMKKFFRGNLQSINTTANAAAYSGKLQNLGEVVNSVCNMIDEEIRGEVLNREWPTVNNRSHEEYDATLTIPILSAPNLGSIIVSMRIDSNGRCFKLAL